MKLNVVTQLQFAVEHNILLAVVLYLSHRNAAGDEPAQCEGRECEINNVKVQNKATEIGRAGSENRCINQSCVGNYCTH